MSFKGKKSAAHDNKQSSEGDPRRRSALEEWSQATEKDHSSTARKQQWQPGSQDRSAQEQDRIPLYNVYGGNGMTAVVGFDRRRQQT